MAILLEVAVVVAVVLKVYRPACPLESVRILPVLPFFAFASAFLLYLVILDPLHIADPQQEFLVKPPAVYSSQTGIFFGVFVMGALLFQAVAGVIQKGIN